MSALNAAWILGRRQHFRNRPRGLVALAAVFLTIVALCALFGSLLAPQNPLNPDLLDLYGGISSGHLLGTDSNGRDLLSRLIVGARTAMLGPLTVMFLSTILGTALALLAAWRGSWVDSVISRAFDFLFAFPGLLLAILATATFGVGLPAAVIALAVSYIPYVGRILRAAALRERKLPYVSSLYATGLGGLQICARHLLPNIRTLVAAQASVMFGYAMIDLAAVSFLGLGVQDPTPDWGASVASGLPGILAGHPQESLYAGILIVLTVISVNLIGDHIGDRQEGR